MLITTEKKVNILKEYQEKLYINQFSRNVLAEENCEEEENRIEYLLQLEIDFAVENLKTTKHTV